MLIAEAVTFSDIFYYLVLELKGSDRPYQTLLVPKHREMHVVRAETFLFSIVEPLIPHGFYRFHHLKSRCRTKVPFRHFRPKLSEQLEMLRALRGMLMTGKWMCRAHF